MTAMSDVTADSVSEGKHNLDDPPNLEDNPWAVSSGLSMDIIPDSSVDFGEMPQLESQESASVPCSSPVAGTFFGPEPAPFSLNYRHDVKDADAEQGNAGLHNMGNTCFMNAGLQCLLSNPRLVKHFLEDLDLNEEFQVTLTGQYANLVRKMWSGQYTIVHPSEFKETLAMYHPQFKDYRQHDCQEFLALLLDSLHEQLNTAPLQNKFPLLELEAGPYYSCKVENGQPDSSEYIVHQSDSVSEPDTPTQPKSQSVSPVDTVITNEVQPHCLSEDSNQSEPSHMSMESSASADCSHRMEPIPESIKSFGSGKLVGVSSSCPAAVGASKETVCSLKVQNIDFQGGGDTFAKATVSSEADITDVTDIDTYRDELDERRLPSLEDLYMKDTKTLNTNVLATEYEHESVTTDSEKFHKEENTDRPVDVQDEIHTFEQLNNMLVYESAKDSPCKPFKETNLLANIKDKFSDKLYSKKCLFSELEQTDEENCSFNNIKRMKVDEEEKNMRMQMQMKKNIDKNLVSPKNIVLEDNFANVRHDLPSMEQTLSVAMDEGDQLSAQDHRVIAQGSGLNNENHMRLKDIRDSQAAWAKYLAKNKSVVVDIFQGQFKSTVVCSECNHISVTFEPFMYLSVPIPYAMERQISVIFVPCDNKQPVRYLLTLNKQDHIRHVKHQLLQLIGEETCDIIVAEVLDNHIARILEDNTMLRFVNDNDRQMYAFEMIPPPQIDEVTSQSDEVTPLSSDVTSTSDGDSFLFANNISSAGGLVSSTVNNTSLQSGGAVVCNSKAATVSTIDISYLLTNQQKSVDKSVSSTTKFSCPDTNLLNNSIDGSVSTWTQNLELREDVDWQRNLLGPADSTEAIPSTSEGLHARGDIVDSTRMDDVNTECGDIDSQEPGELDVSDSGGGNQADQWKSCAICLEEMVDCDLMVHTSCGGTLCQSCLEMSFKHYGETTFVCPVCSTPVDPVEGFIQLNCMADYKPKTRILSVPVIHRLDTIEDGEKKMRLFGHPNILYLASDMSGELLYGSVDRVVACLGNYSIILTDGQGYRCSRCLYTAHCSGCEVSREGQISLQPGDHLAIKFTDLTSTQQELAERYTDHKSMEKLRANVPLTLFDCFEAFTESEVLDEHNPWYCPNCKRNQCANKTMTVWKYPETLVVYLKRFVYHELSSTKIDTKVEFSLEKLDLSGYVSGPETSNLLYDLQSCVCHFGGANSGHYTSYAKHPNAGEWYYYNDETIVCQKPREEDYSNAYILFYQRCGTERLMSLPDKESLSCVGQELPGTSFQSVDNVPCHPGPLNNETVTEMLQKYKKTQHLEDVEDDETKPDSTNLDFYS